MTAASELKSAAVVQEQAQQESRKRKTPGQKAVNVVNDVARQAVTEVRNEAGRRTATAVEQVQAANGSTTAGATQTVAAACETSGSSAAIASKAASMQAIRLPVSVFSRIHESSQLSSRIQYRDGFAARSGRAQIAPQGGRAIRGMQNAARRAGAVQAV